MLLVVIIKYDLFAINIQIANTEDYRSGKFDRREIFINENYFKIIYSIVVWKI